MSFLFSSDGFTDSQQKETVANLEQALHFEQMLYEFHD